MAFFDSYFWPFNKTHEKIIAIFVISAILASIWIVFIKFRWHDEKLTEVSYHYECNAQREHLGRHSFVFSSLWNKTLHLQHNFCLFYWSKLNATKKGYKKSSKSSSILNQPSFQIRKRGPRMTFFIELLFTLQPGKVIKVWLLSGMLYTYICVKVS